MPPPIEFPAQAVRAPARRFALALLASLALHALALWPLAARRVPLPVPAVLAVRLPEPRPEPDVAPPALPAAVAPERRTLPAAEETPVPDETPPPQALQGRALARAMSVLASEEFYPRAAIERGLEGRVVLLLKLDAGGRVVDVEVADSSGHALLDAAARQAARRIGTLPPGRRAVLLPVEFRLD